MNTAILSDGECYYIPKADMKFFKELANRMKWKLINQSKSAQVSNTWVDGIAGKWQDERTASQIVNDIHAARTSNSEIEL